MELQIDKRFHHLTLEQVQTLDRVLTEIIPIHGRGNFPTLEVRAKDMIRMVKERLVEREIQVKDVRLDGCTASHVMVQDNGMGYRDLDIIFGLELPRREDFQVIKEVVLGSLRDLLPCGVNRRKITCLTMKEAYVQKMVKVFNERDRWSLISLSNNRGKTVGLRFVSSQRRQFEFSVDSFQIILDRMLESYWEAERKQGGHLERLLYGENLSDLDAGEEKTEPCLSTVSLNVKEDNGEISAMTCGANGPQQNQKAIAPEGDVPLAEHVNEKHEVEVSKIKSTGLNVVSLEDEYEGVEDVPSKEDVVFEVSGEKVEERVHFIGRNPSTFLPRKASPTQAVEPLVAHICTNLQCNEEELSESNAFKQLSVVQMEQQEIVHCHKPVKLRPDSSSCRMDNTSTLRHSHLESSFPPPAKKTCRTSQDHVPDYFPSPNLPRKISQRMSTTSVLSPMSVPEKWSLLTDLSEHATQLFQPTDILKTIQQKPILMDGAQVHHSNPPGSYVTASECTDTHTSPTYHPDIACQAENVAEPKHSETPTNSMTPQESVGYSGIADTVKQPTLAGQDPEPTETISGSGGLDSGLGPGADSVGLDSGLDPEGGSVGLDSGLGSGADSAGLDSRRGPGADSAGLDSGLGPGADSAGLDSRQVPRADSGGLDSGLGPRADSGGLDSGLGPRADSGGLDSGAGPCSPGRNPTITVEAECMFGDFKEAMDHLRFRLIATHSPEEIRGGGLLRYSDLLVRNFRPASETEIKSLQRYMCSRFFIDFPDVGEQQRKIEAYLRCHFVGNEETSKYDYLMTLHRVIDESTVCLMGHERRQTLNMITVLALRVLGEQNAIPNVANVTCFYQPAPYMAEPIFSSYYIAQAQPPLIYHPYPIHVHMQTGPV